MLRLVLVSSVVARVSIAATEGDFIPVACWGETVSDFPFCDVTKSISDRVDNLISLLSLDEKALLLTARQSPLNAIVRLGVPEYNWGTNCIHGVQSRCGSYCPTSFALPNALGATFNRSLIFQTYSWMALELRALWIEDVGENHRSNLGHVGLDCWAPTINIARDPRWGRNDEVASEDPLVNGVFGTLYTLALQNSSESMPVYDPRYPMATATLKHFDAYSLESYGSENRHNFNAVVSEYMYSDTYWPAFQLSIGVGKAKGVMCSYNEVNGIPSCANQFLQKETLRENWAFEGYITGDTGAIEDIYETQHYVDSLADAVIAALKATVDVDSCHGNCGGVYADKYGTSSPYGNYAATLVRNGSMNESLIDASLKHTLTVRFDLGLFDAQDTSDDGGFNQPYWSVSPKYINHPIAQQLNLEGSMQSMTLLRNEMDTLPFKVPQSGQTDGLNLAVIGPHYNASVDFTFQYTGQLCREYGNNDCVPGMVEEMKKEWTQNGLGKVTYAEGCDVKCSSTDDFSDALSVAEDADALVLMFGLSTQIEGEGKDRKNLSLPGYQSNLAKQLCQLNKPAVLVIINGGTVSLDQLKDICPSILEAWYPGFRGAEAIAATIVGKNNPGGKLPVTVYFSDFIDESSMYEMDVSVSPGKTYKYFENEVIYPFGFGLSYSEFSLTECDSDNPSMDTSLLSVCTQITNEGSVLGSETVFIFMKPAPEISSSLDASRMKRRLVDWYKVELKAGEKQEWQWQMTSEDNVLFLFDNSGDPWVYAGNYTLEFTNGNDGSDQLSKFEVTYEVKNDYQLKQSPYLTNQFWNSLSN